MLPHVTDPMNKIIQFFTSPRLLLALAAVLLVVSHWLPDGWRIPATIAGGVCLGSALFAAYVEMRAEQAFNRQMLERLESLSLPRLPAPPTPPREALDEGEDELDEDGDPVRRCENCRSFDLEAGQHLLGAAGNFPSSILSPDQMAAAGVPDVPKDSSNMPKVPTAPAVEERLGGRLHTWQQYGACGKHQELRNKFDACEHFRRVRRR